MITETITANDSAYLLDIGRQGEREARQIVFDLSWMAENFGDGTAVLMHQRSQDGLPYQVNAVQDENTLTWTVTDTDTAFVGYGKAEIRWTVGDALAKTVTYKTRVAESITGDTEVPDPYQSWYDAMIETVGEEAEQKAEAVAREAAVDAVSGYVEQASESASAASESASAAQASAESAARSAEAAFATDTASGSVATFSDGADGVPVKSLSVGIEPVQSGSGDPSPDNVRPISGHTSAVVTRCGKNLLNRDTEEHGFINANGGIQMDGVSVHSALMAVTEKEKYTFSGIASTKAGTGNKRIHGYDVNGNWVRQLGYLPIEIGRPYAITVTIPNGIKYVRVSHYSADTECLFEKSEIATAYEPYQGQTVTIDLPQTIYGGTLDVGTGTVTVTHTLLTLTGDNVSSVGIASTGAKYAQGSLAKSAEAIEVLSDQYIGVTSAIAPGIRALATTWYIYDDRMTDLATAKSILNASPVQLCYTLTTPITMTMTPEQVTTLLGQNNIYADSGSVSVTYRADTGLYIQKVINA